MGRLAEAIAANDVARNLAITRRNIDADWHRVLGSPEYAEFSSHAGVQAAEWIRPLTTRRHGPLVCENIVLLGGDATAHRELMAWPHWARKHLYGPVRLMFGKFWAGEEGTDRQGHRIPFPPFSSLAVRCAIRSVDPRFNVGIQPVTPSAPADVYALAGTLWTCITGRWPLDYAAAGIEPVQLTPADVRVHIASRRIPLDTAAPWPTFQDILRPVLLGRASDRPTAAELAETLATVAT